MTRPQSEAEYLARLVPSSVAGTVLGRRALFKGALGAGAALSVPALLAACGGSSSGGGASTPSGTVTFGSNYSDAMPKAAFAAVMAGYEAQSGGIKTTSTRSTTTRSRRTSTTTCRASRTTCSPGSPATGCASSPRKGLAGDISDVWTKLTGFSDAFKTASTGDDGKQYFVPAVHTTRGRSSTGSRSWTKYGYTGAEDARRADHAVQADAEGRPGPDRLRRQGRLAGDGHLRHPQHADQRLPVPRRPDGRQGALERPRGQEGLRHLERAAALPPDRLPRPHLAGGRAGAAAEEVRHVPARPRSSRQQFDNGSRTTSTSSPSPRSTPPSARTPSTRRSTAI